MKRAVEVLMMMSVMWGASAWSADPGERTYADPACSARDIDPQKCIIQDGPARLGPHQQGPGPGSGGFVNTPSAASPSASIGASTSTGLSGARGRR